jgi:AcrR family transcriptional regulator
VPTPAKTSRAALVGIARALVDEGGAEALTVSAVAAEAGVKAPSLYKHFADRAALVKAVEISVIHDLEAALRAGTTGEGPAARLSAMARAYRRFALAHPRRYALIYSDNAFDDPELAEASRFSARPLFEELEAAGIDEARKLPLARTFTAWLHGFVSMEIAQAFRLGGSIDEAFEEGLATILGRM